MPQTRGGASLRRRGYGSLVGGVEGFADAHGFGIVSEAFPAIQANHVGWTVR